MLHQFNPKLYLVIVHYADHGKSIASFSKTKKKMYIIHSAGKYFIPFPIITTHCCSTKEWTEGICWEKMG